MSIQIQSYHEYHELILHKSSHQRVLDLQAHEFHDLPESQMHSQHHQIHSQSFLSFQDG